MSKEKMNTKIDKVKGSIKETVGKLTDNKEIETEGKVEKTLAKGKESLDDIKDIVDGVVSGIKNTFEKDGKDEKEKDWQGIVS